MFNQGNKLENKRNEIIMACLSGGQHIDAALEAADRLVPQADIDEARAEDERLADKWLEAQKNRLIHPLRDSSESKTPWYMSVSKWLPF